MLNIMEFGHNVRTTKATVLNDTSSRFLCNLLLSKIILKFSYYKDMFKK